jgi:hypothetical protein
MAKKRHTAEEIVTKLRQVDVLILRGRPIAGRLGGPPLIDCWAECCGGPAIQ